MVRGSESIVIIYYYYTRTSIYDIRGLGEGSPFGGKSLETRRLTATSFGECCQSPFYEYCNMPCELFCCRGSERIEDPLKNALLYIRNLIEISFPFLQLKFNDPTLIPLSLFTMETLRSLGLPPIARQKRMICIEGRRN